MSDLYIENLIERVDRQNLEGRGGEGRTSALRVETKIPDIALDGRLSEDAPGNTRGVDIRAIMTLYHSGNPSLTAKAKVIVIEQYKSYIYKIIYSKFPTYRQHAEEMYQCGIVGMLCALEKFDPDAGNLLSYSYYYILHELVQFVLRLHGIPSLYYLNLQKKMGKALEDFDNNGREATVEGVVSATGLSECVVRMELDSVWKFSPLSMDSPSCLRYLESMQDKIFSDDTMRCIEYRVDFSRAFSMLPIETCKIIYKKAVEGYTFSDIAQEMGISLSTTTRKYYKGIGILRTCEFLKQP